MAVVKSGLVPISGDLGCLTVARPGEPSYLPPVAALPRKPFPHFACLSAMYSTPEADHPRSFVQKEKLQLIRAPTAPGSTAATHSVR